MASDQLTRWDVGKKRVRLVSALFPDNNASTDWSPGYLRLAPGVRWWWLGCHSGWPEEGPGHNCWAQAGKVKVG